MIFEFSENKFGAQFILTPQSVIEAAQLLRISQNTQATKPNIYFNFSTDIPYCNIWLPKIKESVQKNSVSPKSRNK